MRHPIRENAIFWLLAVFAGIYIIGNIGTGSLTTWDEAVYANISSNILKTGDWLVLRQGVTPWFDKPPFYMWCTAFFYKIIGVNEFSTRLTSALFGIATVLLIYIFVKKMHNTRTALLSALLLLAAPHYLHFAKMGMMDVTLTFFITLMIYLFWMGQENAGCLFFSGITLAFAYFTKGAAAFMGPLIIFIYCVFTGDLRLLFRSQFMAGMAISLIAICGLHAMQYLLAGPEALKNYFGFHIFKRATSVIEGHSGGLNFYQKAVFNKNKPWSVIFYAAIVYTLWSAVKERDRRAILILSWLIAVYGIYTLVRTKLHWYVVPIYPAIAISSGILLERFFKNKAFNIALIVLLFGMIIQVPVSWAFKLDFNAKAKEAALHSIKLPYEDDGTIFYYGLAKDKEIKGQRR